MVTSLKNTSIGSFCRSASSKTFSRASWVPYRFSRLRSATQMFNFSFSSLTNTKHNNQQQKQLQSLLYSYLNEIVCRALWPIARALSISVVCIQNAMQCIHSNESLGAFISRRSKSSGHCGARSTSSNACSVWNRSYKNKQYSFSLYSPQIASSLQLIYQLAFVSLFSFQLAPGILNKLM